MATWSRYALAFCFGAVFFAVSGRMASGEVECKVGLVVVLQRDEAKNSAYWVSGEPDKAGRCLFRTDFSRALEGISLPFWLKPNTAVLADHEKISFYGAKLDYVEFTYEGQCDGHWAPAAEGQKPKCRLGAQTFGNFDNLVFLDRVYWLEKDTSAKFLDDSLSARERLALFSYFYKHGNGIPATMEIVCKKSCTGGWSKLLDTIARLAGEVDELPPIPDEARRDYATGVEMLKNHPDDPHEVQEAGDKFWEAQRLAPWWRELYYNGALVAEALGEYGNAKHDLERYIATKPGAAEVADAQARINEISRLAAGLR